MVLPVKAISVPRKHLFVMCTHMYNKKSAVQKWTYMDLKTFRYSTCILQFLIEMRSDYRNCKM